MSEAVWRWCWSRCSFAVRALHNFPPPLSTASTHGLLQLLQQKPLGSTARGLSPPRHCSALTQQNSSIRSSNSLSKRNLWGLESSIQRGKRIVTLSKKVNKTATSDQTNELNCCPRALPNVNTLLDSVH
jgi:hypothetical protein